MARSSPEVVFTPTAETIAGSQLTAFTRFCEAQTGSTFADHATLQAFSVDELQRFWGLFLHWSDLAHGGDPNPVNTDDQSCEHGAFFPRMRLSYVENLLRRNTAEDDDRVVLVAHHTDRPTNRVRLGELRAQVASLAAGLERLGVGPGDRVAALTRNNAESVIAALATAAIGGTFSSAAPEMGVPTILSRFEQLDPVVLVANLAAGDDPRTAALSDHVAEVSERLSSLKAVVALDPVELRGRLTAPVLPMADLLAAAGHVLPERRFPFDHPLFVLFSSGTTGQPKCIVHGAGGTLLEHVKEHRLHHDLRRGDVLFFQTSTGWMMWNWQLSALASGAAIVLYDGPISGPETLWNIVEAEGVTVFGTSPPYLRLCEELGYSPRKEATLRTLRAVLSTGSILQPHQYDWMADNVGALPLQSISGGTDIIGCFALGNPNLPVRRGWLQCRSLGLDVRAEGAVATPEGSGIGELICRNPFPSRPLGFVGDDGTRFHEAYFSQNEGVWTHGDLIEIDLDGHIRMHGRSDGVLNVQGMRIGPAEIYEVLADFSEIREAMAVEQDTPEGPEPSRVVLLLVMARSGTLDAPLVGRIRRELARRASPAHVPGLVVEVGELPTTHSGKRSERAARDAVNGVAIANGESLANPSSLDEIREAVRRADRAAEAVGDLREDVDAVPTVERLRLMWEAILGIAPIGLDESFFEVGGTSLGAVRLLTAIHEQLGVDLPLSMFMHAQTIEAIASIIDTGDADLSVVVALKEGGSGRPLFIMHGLIGDIYELRALVEHLDTDRPIYGVRSLGIDPRIEPQTTVEEMATEYIQQIHRIQGSGPYALAGYSFGGLTAFEMARQLVDAGEAVDRLVLIDTYVHEDCLTPRGRAWLAVSRRARLVAAGLRSPRKKFPRFVRRTLAKVVPFVEYTPPEPGEVSLPPLLRYLEQVNMGAYEAYRPGRYPGPAYFIRARKQERRECNPMPVWSRVIEGGLTIERVPGGHFDMMTEPHVEALAVAVAACL